MRWWSKRKPEGFNLAFLDIMACGLGAITLIFMLVKYHSEQPDTNLNALQAELAGIQNEIKTIESDNSALSAQIEQQKQTLQRQIKQSAQSDQESSATAEEIISTAKEISALERKLAEQKQKADADTTRETTTSSKDKTEQDHLIGLRVSGRRIVILLDNSASMADERLVDIIRIKVSDTAKKKAAPKWRRAIAVAHWIIDRVPDKSEYMLIHYNTTANFLPDRKWLKGGDANARSKLFQAMEKLYPHDATNLHSALELIKTNSISLTDIYVITDSLPTQGVENLAIAQRLKACGIGKITRVSGECRLALFFSAIKSFTRIPAKVNTVLLPIEGDPDAAHAYWSWAIATQGMMISPAGSWP